MWWKKRKPRRQRAAETRKNWRKMRELARSRAEHTGRIDCPGCAEKIEEEVSRYMSDLDIHALISEEDFKALVKETLVEALNA